MSHENEDKPIYNLRNYSKKINESDTSPEDVLTWKKGNLTAYLRGVFDSRGLVFTNDNGVMILSIQHSSFTKLEIYQKALQMLNINSFVHYSQEDNELSGLFKRNIRLFRDKIGFEYPEEVDIFYNFWKTLDWED